MLIGEGCQDPIKLALRTLRSGAFCVAMLQPRHHEAVLEAQQRRHGFPVLALEEAGRLARQPGTDGVEVLRSHFEALAKRYRETLPPRERDDLRSRYLGLLAMAYVRRFCRGERVQPPRWCSELTLAEDAIQQARLTLVDGTGRGAVRAAVLEAEAMVAGVRKQYRRACSVLAEAAELLRGQQPPEWRAQMLYQQGKTMAASGLGGKGEAVAVLRDALATLGGPQSATDPVLRLAVIHELTLAETEGQLTRDEAGVLVPAAARLLAAEELYQMFSTAVMRGQRAMMEGRILFLSGDLRGAQTAFAKANGIFAAKEATWEAARLLADVLLCCRRANLATDLGASFCRGTWQFPAQRDFFNRVAELVLSRLIPRLPWDCHGTVLPFLAAVRRLGDRFDAAGARCAVDWAAGEDRARRRQRERFRALVQSKSRPAPLGELFPDQAQTNRRT